MKVKDLIRSLMDKDPNDDVCIKAKIKLYTNDQKCMTKDAQFELDDVKSGGWPVILTADVTIDVRTTINAF